MTKSDNKLQSFFKNKINENVLTGAVIVAGGLEEDFYRNCFGITDAKAARPMTMDAVFDMASVTKIVGTTTSLALCLEKQLIDLDRPFTDYLPEYRVKLAHPITLRQLATHISGFDNSKPYHKFIDNGRLMLDSILDAPPAHEPMRIHLYACLNFILLGMVIEKVTKKSLGDFATKHIFLPLDMKDSTWGAPLHKNLNRTVSAPANVEQEIGIISDETARSAFPREIGNAGIFSTADDLAKFCRMILRNGEPILYPETTTEFFKNQSPNGILPHGLGWRKSPVKGMSASTIWHTGWTGQALIIDPEKELFIILLTKRNCNMDEFQILKDDACEAIMKVI